MSDLDLDAEVADLLNHVDDPNIDDDADPDDWDDTQEPGEQPPQDEDDPAARPSLNVDQFLSEDEPTYDWVCDQVLERGDRVILTGGEGSGKSTLLRQMAVQLAAGVHPWTLDDIDPVSVFLLDLENSKRHLRRELAKVRAKAGRHLDPDRLRVCSAPAGIDLLRADWSEWLDNRMTANRPDVVILGPLYKLATGDPTSEEVARRVAFILDGIRTRHHCALVIEAHSPYANGAGKRPTRPYGASLWSRWPEFGLNLGAKGELTHWRGARDERAWPAAVKRGGEWPWSPITTGRDATWARIVDECYGAQRALTRRALVERVGVSLGSVNRAIAAHEDDWQAIVDLYGAEQ